MCTVLAPLYSVAFAAPVVQVLALSASGGSYSTRVCRTVQSVEAPKHDFWAGMRSFTVLGIGRVPIGLVRFRVYPVYRMSFNSFSLTQKGQ
jgi:hypothetical protein